MKNTNAIDGGAAIDRMLAERMRRGAEQRMLGGAAESHRRARRRTAVVNTLVAAVAVGAVTLLTQLPQPDGLYVSDIGHRSVALLNVDDILNSKL